MVPGSKVVQPCRGWSSVASIVKDAPLLDCIDEALGPLIDVTESAVATRLRIPVLSLWSRLPFFALFASHLHLRWPGAVKSLPLNPRLGLFPFFASDMELLSRPIYQVLSAQTARQAARMRRFSGVVSAKGDLYPPDWEQAIDRRRNKLEHLVLPASSFISIDHVDDSGDIKPGHRKVIGRVAPRGQVRPRLLVPGRVEVTRHLVRAFSDLDLVLVNAQNIRGRRLAASIAYFLSELSSSVPTLIVASSPADLIFAHVLEPPSSNPVLLSSAGATPELSVKPVNQDRPLLESQFCFATDGLAQKSELLSRVVAQAERTWWATRQSLSIDIPREAAAFETLYADMLIRTPDAELELLEQARQLIAREARNDSIRSERRDAVVSSVVHQAQARTFLVIVRSDAAAEDIKGALATTLDVANADLSALGIDVVSAFGPWPSTPYEACVTAGYFGTSTLDMLFAAGARKAVMIVDPIEARIAVWDIERRFCGVPGLPTKVAAALHSFSATLEPFASPSAEPISLSSLFGEGRHYSGAAIPYTGTAEYVCICFADGSMRQVTANARFEVLGRKLLQLKNVAAKDLHMGDQVVILKDDEHAAFSERLLHVLDQGRFLRDRQARSTWLTTLRAIRANNRVSVAEIRRRMESNGMSIDPTTIRTWLRLGPDDTCAVPEREDVFLAFARAVDMTLPKEVLREWFVGINRLRINHRRIGRELVRAIRGAYFSRLDPVSIAKMEREWGLEAKVLLEAAQVTTVDNVIALSH